MRVARKRGVRLVMGLFVPITVAVSMFATGTAASAEKSKFSADVADYFPATIDGQEVVLEPRSAGGSVLNCLIPPEGLVFIPLVGPNNEGIAEEVFGGIWQCPTGGAVPGAEFVVGLDASKVDSTLPELTKKSLLADAVSPAVSGSVEALQVKGAKGARAKGFTYQVTFELVPGQATTFEIASAEPRKRLFVTAATPAGQDPVPYLKAMLKAGIAQAS